MHRQKLEKGKDDFGLLRTCEKAREPGPSWPESHRSNPERQEFHTLLENFTKLRDPKKPRNKKKLEQRRNPRREEDKGSVWFPKLKLAQWN